ncbi:MAG TPA: lipoprotein-releasing ABC transporter permease subunit [Gammaproteobacteria bacterium]|nr:lipoprotein-releasing ABC transporter permease subunit [Gammaproteobacteria bacterium]
MFQPVPLFVGLRYFRARRRNQFISFISFMSMIAIAIGVMALITVLSVMNGFQNELRSRILSMVSDVTITGYDSRLNDWPQVLARLQGLPHVTGAAPYVEEQAMLANGANMSGAIVRGIIPDDDARVSDVGRKLVSGSLDDLRPGSYNIILGKDLAYALGVVPGDKVIMLISQGNVTPAGIIPRLRRFTVAGIFYAGVYQYDSALALVNLKDAQTLYSMGSAVTGVRLKLDDNLLAPAIAQQLVSRFNGQYYISDWTQQNANLWTAIAIEKNVMFVILSLIDLVAAISIIIVLVMAVTDKQSDIAILRTLGMTPKNIMGVFVVQGTLIGLLGTVLGLVLGILLADNVNNLLDLARRLFHVQIFPASVYYISNLPSDIYVSDVLKVCIATFVLTVLATLYPAWRAARTQPAEALRYE